MIIGLVMINAIPANSNGSDLSPRNTQYDRRTNCGCWPLEKLPYGTKRANSIVRARFRYQTGHLHECRAEPHVLVERLCGDILSGDVQANHVNVLLRQPFQHVVHKRRAIALSPFRFIHANGHDESEFAKACVLLA